MRLHSVSGLALCLASFTPTTILLFLWCKLSFGGLFKRVGRHCVLVRQRTAFTAYFYSTSVRYFAHLLSLSPDASYPPLLRWRKSQVRAFHVPAWTTPHDQGLATLDTSCPDANASGRNGAESDGIEFDGNFTKGRDIAVKDIDDDRVRPGHVNIETTDRKVGAQTSDKQGERTRAMDDSRREGLDESKASSSSVWSPPPQPPSQRVLPPSSTSGAQPWLQPAVCPPPRFTRDMQVSRWICWVSRDSAAVAFYGGSARELMF